jgi:hypothetical protein
MADANRVQPSGGAEGEAPERRDDDGGQADLTSDAIIGTNIIGINAGTFPGGIVAPAAEYAANQPTTSVDEANDTVNLDALERFGSASRETGDEGVSPVQADIESDELNG